MEKKGNLENIVKKYSDVRGGDKLYKELHSLLHKIGVIKEDRRKLYIACDEIYSNISKYAYGGSKGKIDISFKFEKNTSNLKITFIDSGVPFDPTKVAKPSISGNANDRQIGGLGIFVVKKIMDSMEYNYISQKNKSGNNEIFKNKLTLTKKVKLESSA